jgi:mono/diheme cytochrome c family protein
MSVPFPQRFARSGRRLLPAGVRAAGVRAAGVRALALVAALGLCGAAAADVPDTTGADARADAKTLADAIYTRDQARSGKALFRRHCRACHGPEYFRPVFQAWEGQRLDEFVDVMSATMPQSNPGSLPLPDYVQILAYILDENDFPDGEEPLDDWGRGLDAIVITAP